MTLSSGLRRLAEVVDELERADIDVLDASLEPDTENDGRVRATVELSIPVEPAATGTEITVDERDDEQAPDRETDGAGAESGAPSGQAVPTGNAATNGDTGSRTDDDGVVACPEPDCDETFESEPGMKVHRTKVHLSNGTAGDGGTPAYRDPDRLAAVYESEETFPAMRDALDADVSAQTVRRHMIRHGIHDPGDDGATAVGEDAGDQGTAADGGRSDSEGNEDADAPTMPTEGAALADLAAVDVTLPEDLQLSDLRECVEASDTLYDVQQRFDLDRETARDLLAAFDLLELVHGRVATKHERDERKAEVDRRIRTALADSSSA